MNFLDCCTEKALCNLAVVCKELGWELKPIHHKPVEASGKIEGHEEVERLMKLPAGAIIKEKE